MKYLLRSAFLASMLIPVDAMAQDFSKIRSAWLANDYVTMLGELRPLAEQGYPEAQTLLGTAYREGAGVPKNDAEAAKWYTKAATQGYSKAQFNLAVAYANGGGVAKDYSKAAHWYLLAAKQGDENAQFNLAMMYGKGEGLPVDVIAAHMWMNISTQNGHVRGLKGLGIIERQIGPSDIEEAERRARDCMGTNYRKCK